MSFRSRKNRDTDRPDFVLHLGAHRTGSTRLQSILDANREVLARNGIVALTPPRPGKRISPTVRDVVRMLPRKPKHLPRYILRRAGARALFSMLIADSVPSHGLRRLIVSEENLMYPAFLADGSGLYPSTYRRLKSFRNLVGLDPREIHLTIRAYDTFLVSLYAMSSINWGRGVPPFDNIRTKYLAVHRGWPDVIGDISRAFPGTLLKVTRVEHGSMEERVQDLVGSPVFDELRFEGDERINAAPTLEAMAAAAEHRDRNSRDALVARHSDGTRFDPLTEHERERLVRRYKEDLSALERMKGAGIIVS